MWNLFVRAKINKNKLLLLLVFISLQVLGTLYLPTLTATILNDGVLQANLDQVYQTGRMMLLVAGGTGAAAIFSTYLAAEVSTKFSRNLRSQLFEQTQQLSVQDFKQFKTSSLITRATNDVEQVQTMLSMFFEMLLPMPFVVIIGMVLAYLREPQMALIIFITMVIFVTIAVLLIKKVLPIFEKVQTGLDRINERVGQFLSGIRVIRAFNRTKLEQRQMDESFHAFAELNIRINRWFALMMPLILLILNIATVAIVWFGADRITTGEMQIGDITVVMEYAMNILFYSVMALFSFVMMPRAITCAKRIREVLDHRPEIVDGAEKLSETKPTKLEFKQVSFCYSDAENPVLHNVSFSCEAGTTTAIIGGTGSGKSTIAKLIPRLFDVQGGEILLNGRSLAELPQTQLRQKIGFVPQKAFLFSGTIADNLRHGNKNATEEEMNHAVTIAQASAFIESLPNGLDAPVAQGGTNFSGGQKQRLPIAKMLMKKPQVYVFDDSFSALDFKTDAALRKALKEETKEAIVIYAAQRISTIKDADQIIVLDEGNVVGKGTHHELLRSCPHYLDIARSQLSEEELV
ncbi:ABC transporter permease protein [Enterococcus casseliflavus]|uniref:ABC transporter ATP-binding protein n=1 Tax=Enterococcus casseliflavus TaxID=37734 RepID=UPI000E03460E|nr:ABC transporter ATP-binding protein [Enterococcus casseliflavus]GEB28825.1 multidrug ABC transporter ATP-binding protein [Enterococcus casseliflavus]STP33662.1 ABC transporter permease protein [Enterococcus casseliflavus]